MASELELRQIGRRRGNILKLIRQNHEEQLDRMDDSDVAEFMLKVHHMSTRQTVTMLQDMQVLGWIIFKQGFSQDLERIALEEIMLTPLGLTLVTRRQNTDGVVFD